MSCGGSSSETCSSTSDCSSNEFCISQKCRSFSSCSSDEECKGGKCTNGSCVTCTPKCTGNCGSDGCGGSCGSCLQGFICNGTRCVRGCTRNCTGKTCGDDGCGGSCGSCSTGYKCSASGTCSLKPSAIWVLTITKGAISEKKDGTAWDILGGLPDPRVCIKINNQESCTKSIDDTLSPVWNQSVHATTSALQAGLLVRIEDEDVTDYETICSEGLINITEKHFKSGVLGVQCKYGRVELTLKLK